MSSNRLYHHYKRQLATFKEYFNKTSKRMEVEDIHQLRVSIKKIRTNLKLMEIASWGTFRKRRHFTLFSKLFNCAGALREIQVNQTILDVLDLENGYEDELCQSAIHFYRDELLHQSQKANERLIIALRVFNFRKLKKLNKRLKENIVELGDERVIEESNAFIEKQIEKINKLRTQVDNDRELHKIRMHLKSMTETYRLNIKMFANEIMENRVEQLKVLEDLIGEWHDLMMLIASMEHYSHSEAGAEFETPLINVIADITERGREIRGEVVVYLDQFFH